MTENAYKKAGVDIEAGAALVQRIKPHVKTTMRAGVMSDIGGFGALFDIKKAGYDDPILVSSTDGVGTKLKIAIETGMHDTIGIDLVAMCVNDVIVQGAEPLFFLDYFATGKLENDVAEAVIKGVADGCRQAGCALIGGETAEMPGVYKKDDYDLAGFTVGAVSRNRIITGEKIEEGDMILGLASSGPHSNGYSLIRNIVETVKDLDYKNAAPFEPQKTIGEVLLVPTKIYVRPLLKVLQETGADNIPLIKGMAHITGGGLAENIPRIIPDHLMAVLDAQSWGLPPVFRWLAAAGNLSPEDMAQTFNCGIGMALICKQEDSALIIQTLEEEGETVYKIGQILKRESHNAIRIENRDKAWKS
ncbi:MAG: phosphoribosylformylglycinamidine cyclo-ligase [Alphaproteobacteria bacterium CG_4_9_14_3_um_filter_47_13]|nr:MAG: phosphoribosylformylglycinamidine cyclo-ligase [Alphaproteobacteria bacterium CG_4_9_14_3_um_filter_47_13]